MREQVRYLSFEVNLPEFRAEGMQCIDLLRQLLAVGEFNFMTDCHSGLALDAWLPYSDFRSAFEQIREKSVEVFWRTPSAL
jgi:hypothetical protein